MLKNAAAPPAPQHGGLPIAVPLEDAPRMFGVSKSHIYRMSKAGHIDLRKVGRKTIVMTHTMLAYLGSLPPATEIKPE
ncbi:helix-turn-helix domain-containing protein [Acetobacter orientalis]|uniref:helix-turn-helix domain-containing protein n=1 Tax=Acetobacter orientalis TaxID=146474 RepID=UPI0020A1205F|nr:helix-turn-helix domain-containing protein [Acetobacter orientalis]MCP1214622.1 helix-turn-helix domain-containing protein [Acetobacter orientalis]MCP1218205.1 helix-turn-helix domain-containing protein [Acetobacter orientalis]